MKPLGLLVLPLLVVAVRLPAAGNGSGPRIDVNVVGEVFAPAYAQPTAAQPAYYVLADGGLVERGNPVGGDPAPSARVVTQTLGRQLAAANFRPATVVHAPTLLLVSHWGVLRRDDIEIAPPYEIKASLRARIRLVATPARARRIEGELTDRLYRREMRADFQGADFLGVPEQDTLDIARDSHYFVIVTAYDYAAAAENRMVPVWRVKLSTFTRRTSMADALPALIADGRVYFGRTTAEAIYERMPLYPETGGKPGELPILGDVPPAPTGGIAPATLRTIEHAEFSDLTGVKTAPAA